MIRLVSPAWAVVSACVVLAGCATYRSEPLPDRPALVASPQALPGAAQMGPGPYTVAQVASLAVLDNPDLRALRTQHGVGEAQLLQAGLLPNPQFSGAYLPLLAGVGDTAAWNAALSMDIRALVTFRSQRDAAEASARQVDAQILWQEWQVAGSARTLAVDLVEGARSLALLQQAQAALSDRVQHVAAAVARGDETLISSAPDVAALQGVQSQIDTLERTQLDRRNKLNALLGLQPDAALPLADQLDLPPVDGAEVRQALPLLPRRRPDLVALQLGYQAQEARVRGAILSQFPALVLGATGGSDNANVRNAGPQLALGIPLFDRNQGGVAIARATREQLRQEYAARLDAATGEVGALVSAIEAIQARLTVLRQELPPLETAEARGARALANHDIDDRAYVDLVTARLTKAQDILAMEQSLLEQEAALGALMGAGLPQVAIKPQEASS